MDMFLFQKEVCLFVCLFSIQSYKHTKQNICIEIWIAKYIQTDKMDGLPRWRRWRGHFDTAKIRTFKILKTSMADIFKPIKLVWLCINILYSHNIIPKWWTMNEAVNRVMRCVRWLQNDEREMFMVWWNPVCNLKCQGYMVELILKPLRC